MPFIPLLLLWLAGLISIALLIDAIESSQFYTKSDMAALLTRPGAYILYDVNKNVIHVGGTGDLKKRLNNHEKYQRMRFFRFFETSNETEAFKLETALQKKYEYKGR